MCHALKVGELERLTLRLGQGANQIAHLPGLPLLVQSFLGVGGANLGRQNVHPHFSLPLPFAFAAQVVDRDVACQREQPGGKSAPHSLVACRVPPESQEYLLHQVVRGRGMLGDTPKQGIDHSCVAVVEQLQSVGIVIRYA